MVVVSWIAAVVACLGYGFGSVLQSVGARRTAQVGGVAGVTGVAVIVTQVPYLLGLAADGMAFLANIVALWKLPLFLVQSILTGSVGVTAVIAAIRGSKLSWKDWASLAVLGTGLVLLSISAASQNAIRISATSRWLILASSLLPIVIGLVGMLLRNRYSGLVIAFASGLAFTGVAVASRGISADQIGWRMLADPLVWTIVVEGIIGSACFALALQRRDVTSVTAVTFMAEMVIPSIVGLLLFGDSVGAGLGAYALVGFVFAIGGTISLVRFAE